MDSRVIGAAVLVLFILFVLAHSSSAQLDRLRKSKSLEPVASSPMVEVPAGEFVMGFDGSQALEDERPLHRVWLDTFSIELYEVTTVQYASFLASEKRAAPWQWETVDLTQHGDRPVIGLEARVRVHAVARLGAQREGHRHPGDRRELGGCRGLLSVERKAASPRGGMGKGGERDGWPRVPLGK